MVLRLLVVGLFVGSAGAARRSSEWIAKTGCNTDATKVLVHSFVRNYGAGRVAVVNRMFAPKPRFQWYSTGKPGERIGRPSYVRSNLARYFRSRVRVHERLRIT
jgi:hypothetical protein